MGFTLIELMVSMFILALVLSGMVAVSVAGFQSYQKARAIKIVMENTSFALNSIAKDVRMGKITPTSSAGVTNGIRQNYLLLTRNSTGVAVCYVISGNGLVLGVREGVTNPSCNDGVLKVLIDLTGTGMVFDATSGFRSCPSAPSTTDMGYYTCPSSMSASELRRGWAEINLNVVPTDGVSNLGMSSDAINVQTTVSSRDYGVETAP